MSRHLSLGIFISLLFHGLGVCSIVYVGVLLPDVTPPLVIDFSIEKTCTDCSSSNGQKNLAPAIPEKIEEQLETQQVEALLASIPEPVKKRSLEKGEVKKQQSEKPEATKSVPHKISPVKIKKHLLSEEVGLAVVEVIPEPVPADLSTEEIEAKQKKEFVEPIPGVLSANEQGETTMAQATALNVQATLESLQKRYLKAHFSYIKNAIQLKTRYPKIARKMGWEGKVLLSFIIGINGYVEGIKVIKSCGFRVLDQNAIKTIQQCAPFPKPPARAELTLPITYRLN